MGLPLPMVCDLAESVGSLLLILVVAGHRLLEALDGFSNGLAHFRDALRTKEKEHNHQNNEQFGQT